MKFLNLHRNSRRFATPETRAAGKTENMVILVLPGSVVVEANQSGLLELARQILLVAAKDIDGAHQDFDKARFASRAQATLTVALNNSLL